MRNQVHFETAYLHQSLSNLIPMKSPPILRFVAYFSILIVAIVNSSCKKEDPEPPLAEQVTGEYIGTYYTIGTTTKITLPAVNAAGVTGISKLSVTRVSDEIVNAKVTFTTTDKTGKSVEGVTNYSNLALKRGTSSNIEGYQGTVKNLLLANGELSLSTPDIDPTKTTVFYGKKN